MKLILFAAAFLLIALGVAVIAAIPLLFSYARRQDEIADSLSVSTQIRVAQYNNAVEALERVARATAGLPPPPTPPKKPSHLKPLNGGKDGPGKGNSNLPPKG